MSDIKKIVDQSVSPEEQEQLIEQLFDNKFDKELRSKWESKLEKEYETPHRATNKSNSNYKKIFYLFTIAAIVALLIILLIVLKPFSAQLSAETIAHQYIASSELYDIRASKGIINDEGNRIEAITTFNKKSYQQSIDAYRSIESLSTQDFYYMGLSHIRLSQYHEASKALEKALKTGPSDQLKQEINWYLGLSYVLDSSDHATKQLAIIKKGDWKYQEAQALIEALE